MLARLIARLVASLAVIALVFVISRALIRALPGDPVETAMAESGTALPIEEVRAELGLDAPFSTSLIRDARRALHGDLGISFISRRPIAPILARSLGRTVTLAGLALAFALLFSLVIGVSAAGLPDERTRLLADRFCIAYGACIAALPTPWIGPVLMLVFCVWIPLLPTGGHILLPAVTLALGFSGLWSRLLRDRVRETLEGSGSVNAARARGVHEWKVVLKYGLAPCSGALLAYLGTQAGALIAGAFITETLFDWHGLGFLLVDAVLKRDYPTVEWAVFTASVASLAGTAAGDWMQRRADPRLRSDA
ncbi:MAG: ABC transporter permease [Oligoflexia bacterium]|nr:ABC transporter permease [Oligoflexia bacterium]